ncbi:ABC transporter ATP-binding protein [Oryzibacter oryziterrae]|uniref:ABC transporter ATP-binding protein n=1 Tax=Oryzibacter oryziterrae TaxID=2766474 RepID=UPI001F2B8F79|nr:ABC transporter ATP-binding protein [Oryzibacter oryziterrae]
MSDRQIVLKIADLTLRFGSFTALDAVNLTVSAGERVALLGHNGAGKSTLFKTVLGFLKPDGGTLTVAGARPGSDHARGAVSYLPEQVAFPKALTGTEIITHFARLKGVAPSRSIGLLETVGIADAADRAIGTYSKGMRQRLGLAQALIGKPALLLLDEPTSGLDPLSRGEFYAIIDRVAAEGTAVLLSSHSLTEVESRTDRVAILARGQLKADGALADLARAARLPIRIRVEAEPGRADAVRDRIGGDRINGRSVLLNCLAEEKIGLLARVAALGKDVTDVDITLPGLDDVYRHYSGIDLATHAMGDAS